MKKQPTLAQLQREVDDFNQKYKPGCGIILDRDGEGFHTTLKSEAYIMGGHSAVAFFEGVRGCYDISKVIEP